MRLRVLIAVTHLLGVGHLARAAAIARGLVRAGHEVTLASGGNPAPLVATEGLCLIQLPPVHIVGTAFSTLLGADGKPVGETIKTERRRMLLEALRQTKPHVILTELFPFGRRTLADEFLALVEAARLQRPLPVVLSSIRDVLITPVRAGRVEETHARLLAHYDGVLVHGDERLLPLERSWPVTPEIAPLLNYTGYVDDTAARVIEDGAEGAGEIIVSGGGSAASLPLYRAALGAAGLVTDHRWRLLVGRGVAVEAFDALAQAAPDHVIVERARPDFPALLSRAALSVSQAGYNTVIDVLNARVRAVLVPFEAGNETEQRLRAEGLAGAGVWPFAVLGENMLSPETLARAVRDTLACPVPETIAISRDGIARSIAAIERYAAMPLQAALSGRVESSDRPEFGSYDGAHRSHAGPTGVYRRLAGALDEAYAAGREVVFWWRDDDAIISTPALDCLLALARRHAMPVAVATIPGHADAGLAARLAGEPLASLLVHGLAHVNHAPQDEKKTEFGGHRPSEELDRDAAQALRLAAERFGDALLPVFVPPWNRIDSGLASRLPALGYRGLSTFGSAGVVRGLSIANTHIDPIAWHSGGGLVEHDRIDERAAAAVINQMDDGRPIILGLLTHHLVHDEELWGWIDTLLAFLIAHPAIVRRDAHQLFLRAQT